MISSALAARQALDVDAVVASELQVELLQHQ